MKMITMKHENEKRKNKRSRGITQVTRTGVKSKVKKIK